MSRAVHWCTVHGAEPCEMLEAARAEYNAAQKRKPHARLIMTSTCELLPGHGAVYTRAASKESALRVLKRAVRSAKAAATRKANREAKL